MPWLPLTSRFGKRDGQHRPARWSCRRSCRRSRRCPRRCRAAAASRSARACTRCSGPRPAATRRRASRSCRGRRPAGGAGEVLRHADEGVVDRGVAVRVVLAHHVADDARRTCVCWRSGRRPGVEHPVEDPAVHRLQPVADVGQRARHDDRHRVVEERALHLLLDLDGLDVAQRLLPIGHAFVSFSGSRPVLGGPLGRPGRGRRPDGRGRLRCRGSGRPSRSCWMKRPPRLDVVAHQDREHLVGDRGLLDRDLQQRALRRVHGRLPELLGVHLAEALEPLRTRACGLRSPQERGLSAASSLRYVFVLAQPAEYSGGCAT